LILTDPNNGQTVAARSVTFSSPPKEQRLSIGEFELTIKHPAHVVIPQDIDRLLKSISKKVEEWALASAQK
jgi:hypothetical protein